MSSGKLNIHFTVRKEEAFTFHDPMFLHRPHEIKINEKEQKNAKYTSKQN